MGIVEFRASRSADKGEVEREEPGESGLDGESNERCEGCDGEFNEPGLEDDDGCADRGWCADVDADAEPDHRSTGSGDLRGEGSAEEGWEGIVAAAAAVGAEGESSRRGFCLVPRGSRAAPAPLNAPEEELGAEGTWSPRRVVRMSLSI